MVINIFQNAHQLILTKDSRVNFEILHHFVDISNTDSLKNLLESVKWTPIKHCFEF